MVRNNDCVYGIPDRAKRIIKFDPTNPDTASTVGEKAKEWFECDGNGVLGGDGNIYAANRFGQVLKVDTTSNNYTWIGDRIYSGDRFGWGDPIVGADMCIYWLPSFANHVLKFDPETKQLPSLVGNDLGEEGYKLQGGALASDGAIYCIPSCSSRALALTHSKDDLRPC